MQTYNETAHQTVTEQVQSLTSLSGKGVTTVELVSGSDARPGGCVAFPVSSSAAVFLRVKGRVDLDAEIAKAAKKLDRTQAAIAKQQKLLADQGYLAKVSAEQQEGDRRRLADYESEARGFEATIRQFEDLKLE